MFQIETDAEVNTGGITYCVIDGGDFDECDLVEVYRKGDKDKTSIGAFQACFIKYGYNYGEENTGG